MKWPIAAFPAILLGVLTASLNAAIIFLLLIELISVVVIFYSATQDKEFVSNSISGMFLEHYMLDTSEEVSLTLILSIFFCRVLGGIFFYFNFPLLAWPIFIITMLHKKI